MSYEEAEILRSRAYSFLRNAKALFNEGEYDLAAFNVEQFCQLLLKYKLLMKTGSYPRAYSIVRLVELSLQGSWRKTGQVHRVRDHVPHKARGCIHRSKVSAQKIREREVKKLLLFSEKFGRS